jgi:hypothetical protein
MVPTRNGFIVRLVERRVKRGRAAFPAGRRWRGENQTAAGSEVSASHRRGPARKGRSELRPLQEMGRGTVRGS